MTIIGLTGPTGAGKTTVLEAFSELGCVTLDCDLVYHQLLETDPQLTQELTERFGRSILDSCGKLDRKALGAVVFGDENALGDLNAITHRRVMAELDLRIAQAEKAGARGVVLDAIALFESGLADRCQVTAAVIAPPEIRLRRIMARDGIGREYALARIAAQKPNEYYVNLCDYTIVNDSSLSQADLKAQVRELFRSKLC